MKYLLDVNTLLAAILELHSNHDKVDGWIRGKNLALCPISEIGFLRISTHPKVYNLDMAVARAALKDFVAKNKTDFLAADLSAREVAPKNSEAVTDTYLAELAHHHKMKLVTLDAGISHPSVEMVKS